MPCSYQFPARNRKSSPELAFGPIHHQISVACVHSSIFIRASSVLFASVVFTLAAMNVTIWTLQLIVIRFIGCHSLYYRMYSVWRRLHITDCNHNAVGSKQYRPTVTIYRAHRRDWTTTMNAVVGAANIAHSSFVRCSHGCRNCEVLVTHTSAPLL